MKARIVPVVAALLLCVACTRLAPSERAPVPAATTTQVASQPTPAVVVSTTAKQLDTSAVATLIANPLFDVPEGKYLLLRAADNVRRYFTECVCIPREHPNWSELSLGEQGQAMRDMIQQGAKGFVDVSSLDDLGPCFCTDRLDRRDPINELPFTYSSGDSGFRFPMTLYRVDRDGTITAQVENVTYSFKPGDTWSYEYSVYVHQTERHPECESYTYSYKLSFQNDGLMDASQFLPLSAPPPSGARPPSEASIGDIWTRPADGMVMVYVPAGEFLMGSSDADAWDNEKPQHTVYLDAYWIDQTEVTNAQYRKCVEAGACREPRCWDEDGYNAPSQPVVCVSWDDAQAYAAWAGGRLPTEAEWEKAGRGTDGRIYPWGNSAPDCMRANYWTCLWRLAVVGSYLDGASPYGVLDMAGNVREWVTDWYDEDYYTRSPARNPQGPDSGDRRVLRGGAFDYGVWYARCAARRRIDPNLWGRNLGFRLVASPTGL